MKKPSLILFILLALFAISPGLKAQYSIPTATQQPAWVFPIYFEEGTGLRDTIYLGYDPDANGALGPVPGSIDTVFGEEYVVIDTSKFQAYWTACCDVVPDTVLRVYILDSTGQMGFAIGFTKGILPLTVKWDKSLFYSDSLPYPNQSPAPYAQGLMTAGNGMYALGADSTCWSSINPMMMSDTLALATCSNTDYCRSDSIYYTYYCTSQSAPISGLGLIVTAWSGYLISSIEDKNKGKLSGIDLYPNPATHSIQLEHATEVTVIKLFTISGQEVSIHVNLGKTNSSINILHVPSGIYFLQIGTPSSRSFRKVVISH